MSELYEMRMVMNRMFDKLEETDKKLAKQQDEINQLNSRVVKLEKQSSLSVRDKKIIEAVRRGEKSQEIAREYQITPSRVTQIAPRKFN